VYLSWSANDGYIVGAAEENGRTPDPQPVVSGARL
jgi:hypothetical protein